MGGILGGGSGGGGGGLLDPLGILGGGKGGGGLLGGGSGGGGLGGILGALPDPLGIGKILFGSKEPDPTKAGAPQPGAPTPAGVQYAHQQQSAVAPGFNVQSPMGPTGFGVGGGGAPRQ